MFDEISSTFAAIEFTTESGQLTYYQWPSGASTTTDVGPFMACGWTTTGWLLGCPATDGIYFDAAQVDLAKFGIPVFQTPTPMATATPAHEASQQIGQPPEASFDEQKAFAAWLGANSTSVEINGIGGLRLNDGVATGSDIVCRGLTATASGSGVPVWVPGDQLWIMVVHLTAVDVDLTVFVNENDAVAEPHIDNLDAMAQEVEVVGTGTQCTVP